LRYGTVPIVRGVGGLINTVFDYDYDTYHPLEERNGFVFFESDNYALESAMGRAIDLWYKSPDKFQKLAAVGMKCDYSWNHPGQQYLGVYDFIRA
jgi:starch synthase